MDHGVRTARPEDAAAVAGIYAPYVLETAISFEETPPSPEEMRRRIEGALRTHPFLVFDAGEIQAFAYASPHRPRAAYRWSADVSVYVARGLHRRGLGARLYTQLIGILQRQGLHAAFAGIALPNGASVGLHEAMGFSRLGDFSEVGYKFGRWHDVGWWRRALAAGDPAGEPIAFADLASPPGD